MIHTLDFIGVFDGHNKQNVILIVLPVMPIHIDKRATNAYCSNGKISENIDK